MSFVMKLTAAGAAKIAAATAGDPVALTQMAVGDGDGVAVPDPTGAETDLVSEVWRDALTSLSVSLADPEVMIAEAVIGIAAGPFTVREVGIFDAEGDLFAYGNFPETYKPTAAEGSAREMLVRVSIRVTTAANVTILIDESAVFATRAWSNGRFLQIAANLADVADPVAARTNLSAAPLANPIFTGVPQAPTADPGTNTNQLSTTAFVQAAIAALINAAPGALDTLDELAAALGDDANFAATITAALALRAPLASPVFTGDPRAPTPAPGDNDTSIATSAFVAAALTARAPQQIGSTINSTSGTTITISNLLATAFNHIYIEFLGVSVSALAWLQANFSDNGTSWSADTPLIQTGATDTLYGSIFLPNFRRDAGQFIFGIRNLAANRSADGSGGGVGAWRLTNGVNHFRIGRDTGNFDAGQVRAWGIY
jgi:phage-related tail fiber protein